MPEVRARKANTKPPIRILPGGLAIMPWPPFPFVRDAQKIPSVACLGGRDATVQHMAPPSSILHLEEHKRSIPIHVATRGDFMARAADDSYRRRLTMNARPPGILLMNLSTRSRGHTASLIASAMIASVISAAIIKYINVWIGAGAIIAMACAIAFDWGYRPKRDNRRQCRAFRGSPGIPMIGGRR